MKILITGGSGFVGRNIARVLDPDYDIYTPTSSQLDFTDSKEVEKYFQNKFFDVVIHCAITGGRRNEQDSAFTLHENLKMFFNLMNNRDRFDRFINFSSGADFDKTKPIAIITRATLNFGKLFEFWQSVPKASNAIKSAKGVSWFKGIGEVPFIQQATFSIWENLESVTNFAYKNINHSEIVKKTRKRKWYKEDLFSRFEIIDKKTKVFNN